VVVEADHVGVGIRLGDQDRRRPVPAADVGDPAARPQALVDAVEGGDPFGDEVRLVAAAEEALAAAVDDRVLLVPAVAVAAEEALADVLAGAHEPDRHLERAGQEDRAGVVGERHHLLRAHRVPLCAGVVGDVAAGGLGTEPLAHVALRRVRVRGELVRGQRPVVREGAVEAELVADDHERRVRGRAAVDHDLPDERLEALAVDCLLGGLHPVLLRWIDVDPAHATGGWSAVRERG